MVTYSCKKKILTYKVIRSDAHAFIINYNSDYRDISYVKLKLRRLYYEQRKHLLESNH